MEAWNPEIHVESEDVDWVNLSDTFPFKRQIRLALYLCILRAIARGNGIPLNTLRTGDADLRFYITTVQDGCRKYGFLTRACFPYTIHFIM